MLRFDGDQDGLGFGISLEADWFNRCLQFHGRTQNGIGAPFALPPII
jgi:hypothetical protein